MRDMWLLLLFFSVCFHFHRSVIGCFRSEPSLMGFAVLGTQRLRLLSHAVRVKTWANVHIAVVNG